jgi:hypothetical protein
MKTQIIKFDGLKESQINRLLLSHPYVRQAIIQIAYASYSNKMRDKIINGN